MSERIEDLGSDRRLTAVKAKMMELPTEGSVVVPEGVKGIALNAFYGKRDITEITLPKSLIEIDTQAFYCCTGLTSITIPENVTCIGEGAFQGCKNLKEVNWKSQIPLTQEMIENIFAECPNLEVINYQANIVNELENTEQVFENEQETTQQEFPKNITYNGLKIYGINPEGHIVIPRGVESIDERAFFSCIGLTSIAISESVTTIGHSAFCNCKRLTNITIPESVINVGDNAFYGCKNLKEVNWESPIRLTQGKIEEIFAECPNLEAINYRGTRIELNTESLDDIITKASYPMDNGKEIVQKNMQKGITFCKNPEAQLYSTGDAKGNTQNDTVYHKNAEGQFYSGNDER